MDADIGKRRKFRSFILPPVSRFFEARYHLKWEQSFVQKDINSKNYWKLKQDIVREVALGG